MVEVKRLSDRRRRRAGRRGDVGAAVLRGPGSDPRPSGRRPATGSTTPTCCDASPSSRPRNGSGSRWPRSATRWRRCPTTARRTARTGPGSRQQWRSRLDEQIACSSDCATTSTGASAAAACRCPSARSTTPATVSPSAAPAPTSSMGDMTSECLHPSECLARGVPSPDTRMASKHSDGGDVSRRASGVRCATRRRGRAGRRRRRARSARARSRRRP